MFQILTSFTRILTSKYLLALIIALIGLQFLSQTPVSAKSEPAPANIAQIPQSESEALWALYEQSPTGFYSEWINNYYYGWGTSTSPCNWQGVTCEGGTVVELSIRDVELDALPPEIGYLTNLTYLNLINNGLPSLPPEIGNLTKLEKANFMFQDFTTVPSEFEGLESLEDLSFYSNPIDSLPTEFGNLDALKKLSIWGGYLTEIPIAITSLQNLEQLSLYQHDISIIPPEIENMTQLKSLYLFGNNLSTLPVEIGNLTNLKSLDLSENVLTELPTEIGGMSSLTSLGVDDNLLTGLPAEIGDLLSLRTLSAERNQMTDLPDEILNLTLDNLFLCENPFVFSNVDVENWVNSQNGLSCNVPVFTAVEMTEQTTSTNKSIRVILFLATFAFLSLTTFKIRHI